MNSTSRLSADRILYVFCALVILVLAVVICSGCQGGGGLGMPGGGSSGKAPSSYESDLTALIKEATKEKGDLSNASIRENPGGIGVCELQTSPTNVSTIANAFGMSEIPDAKTLEFAHVDQHYSGLASLFGRDELMRAYGIFGKPPNLKCKGGRQFEYMVIFYRPKTNEACIETKQVEQP